MQRKKCKVKKRDGEIKQLDKYVQLLLAFA